MNSTDWHIKVIEYVPVLVSSKHTIFHELLQNLRADISEAFFLIVQNLREEERRLEHITDPQRS